jgi:hypothetical protein
MFGEGATQGRPVSSHVIARRQPRIGTTVSRHAMPRAPQTQRATSPSVNP